MAEESDDEVLDRARKIVLARMGQQGLGTGAPAPPELPPGQGANPAAAPPQSGPGQGQTSSQAGFESHHQEASYRYQRDQRASRETVKKVGGAAWRNKRAIAFAGVYLAMFAFLDGYYGKLRGGGELVDFGAAIHFKDPFHYPVDDIHRIAKHL